MPEASVHEHRDPRWTKDHIGATLVGLYLVPPPLGILLRPCAVERTAMPEASVHEHRDPRWTKDHIGATVHPLDRAAIHSVAEAKSMKRGTYGHFCTGITASR